MASRARTLLRQFLRRTHPDLLQQQDSAVRVTNTRSMQHLNALMELSAPPDTLRPQASRGTASGRDVYPLEFHYLDPTAATPVSTSDRDTSVAATNTAAPSTTSSSSAPDAAPQLGYVKLTVSPPASLAQPTTSGAILGAAGRKQRAAHEEARARAADRYVAGVLEQLLRRMGVPVDLGTAGTGDEAAHVAGTGTSFAGLGLGRLGAAEDDLGRRGGRRRRRSSWGGSASSSSRAAGVFPPRGSLREEMNRLLSDEGFMMMHRAMPQGTGAAVGTRRRRRRGRGPGAAGSARANADANASANANTSAASAGNGVGSLPSAESSSSDNGVAAAGRGASRANVHRVLQTDPTYAAKVLLSIVAAGRIKSRLGDDGGDNDGVGSIGSIGGVGDDGSDSGGGIEGGLAPEADVALAMASITHALMFHATWDTFCWIRDDDRVHVSIVQQKEEEEEEDVVAAARASAVDAQGKQSADGGGHTDDSVVIAITLDMNGPQVGEAFDHAFQAARPG